MSDTPTEAAPETSAPEAAPAEEPQTFDRKYVEALRRENAGHRTKAKQLEEQLSKVSVFADLDDDARQVFADGASAYKAANETGNAEDWDSAAAWFLDQHNGLAGEPAPEPPAPTQEHTMTEPNAEMQAAAAAQGITKEDLRDAWNEWQAEQEHARITSEVNASLKSMGYDDPRDPIAVAISQQAAKLAKETGRTDTRALFSEAADLVKADVAKRFSLMDNQTDTTAATPGEEQPAVSPPGGVAPGKTGGGDEPAPRNLQAAGPKRQRIKDAADLVRSLAPESGPDQV